MIEQQTQVGAQFYSTRQLGENSLHIRVTDLPHEGTLETETS